MRTLYSPLEIAGSYRRSGEKKEQIKILAELNGCDKKTIEEILTEQGFDISKAAPRRKKEEEKNMEEKLQETAVKEEKKTKRKPQSGVEKGTGTNGVPEIVVKTVRDRMKMVSRELCSLADRQRMLKEAEEDLTREYAELEAFVKGL